MTEEADVAALPSTRRRGLRETRLLPPRIRRGSVPRTRLLALMRSARDCSVVSIVAPPGYGKTTVLAQWASRDPRPVAWVTINDGHNDPVVLFTDLATVIHRQEPLDPAVFDAIGTPGLSSYPLAGRLLAALADLPAPVLVVIDDAHRLNEPACLDALSEFVGHLPPGWQVAIGGRDAISVSLARLRGHGLLLEIGAAELAMDEGEAARLLRPIGLTLALDDLETLVASVHGWPALIYLAGLAATRSGEPAIRVASGTDGYVAEYLRSELLDGRPVDQVTLLLDSAILERFNGSLCDAVVGRTGSAAFLTALARSTLLVDEQGGWYRYHSLLRDFLRSELERRAPGRIRELHRRAALWYDRHGFPDDAVEHAFAAGDVDGAANAVGGVVLRYHWSGRRATIRAWLARFRDEDLEERPWLAVIGAIEESRGRRRRLRGAPGGHRRARLVRGETARRHRVVRVRAIDPARADVPGRRRRMPSRRRPAPCSSSPRAARGETSHLGPGERPPAHRRDRRRRRAPRGCRGCGPLQPELRERGSARSPSVPCWRSSGVTGAWRRHMRMRPGRSWPPAHLDGYQVTAMTRAALARIAARRGDLARRAGRARPMQPAASAAADGQPAVAQCGRRWSALPGPTSRSAMPGCPDACSRRPTTSSACDRTSA